LYPNVSPLVITDRDMAFLKSQALRNARKRIRICAHRDAEDVMQEMFIVHARGCFVRPHKHINKPESLFVLEGEATAVFFDEAGEVTRSFMLGGKGENTNRYYRLETDTYHMLIINSDFFVFHEVTMGPFRNDDTVFPQWAPEEGTAGQIVFMDSVQSKLEITG
jgi:cupin fold WbuC family metalloprotein